MRYREWEALGLTWNYAQSIGVPTTNEPLVFAWTAPGLVGSEEGRIAMVRLGFGIATGRNMDSRIVAEQARVAEDLGFTHMGFVDQPGLDRDVHMMMAIAAASTSKLRIGHSVTDPYSFHPWYIANATASLDEWSGGRAYIGIGAGGPFGKAIRPRPASDLRDAVLFMRRFLAGEEAEFQGTTMQSEWLRRELPIYVAAEGPRACRLAGELGNTIVTSRAHPAFIKWKIGQMRLGAEQAGRDPSQLDIRLTTMVYLADRKEDSLREGAAFAMNVHRVHQLLQTSSPEVAELRAELAREPDLLDDIKAVHDAWTADQHERVDMPSGNLVTQRVNDFVNVTGNAEEVCARLAELAELGVTTVECALYGLEKPLEMMYRIHDDVMPQFRS